MEEDDIIRALAALAHPMRLQVFRALVVVGQSGLTPGVMAEALGMHATTLSFHLKELAAAGLVSQERDGRNLVYRAAYDRMNALARFLTENCCAGLECAVVPTAQLLLPIPLQETSMKRFHVHAHVADLRRASRSIRRCSPPSRCASSPTMRSG